MHPCGPFFRPVRRRARLLAAAISVALASCEQQQSPTAPEADAALATATTALAFRQLSAGATHTCGLTTDNRAYCWGTNTYGQLGDGTTTTRLRPVAVATTLRFQQISAGGFHTCGVTAEYRAYCWGNNNQLDGYNGAGGQLGDGTTTQRLRPVAVTGGYQFRELQAGLFHTCGVNYPTNLAYCWGSNELGELGDGTQSNRLRPVPVAGNRQFSQVSPGSWHTCGVTTSSRAFCWGSNEYGQLGDSSTAIFRPTPTSVSGTRQFRQIDAGYLHTCGVTTSDRAFCWGYGRDGRIGDGKTYLRFWPKAVAGGLQFALVTAGSTHSCGETTLNQAYCWGDNGTGSLGDGTTIDRLTPVPVAGGLQFKQLSAGAGQTCGKTPAAVGYCWGSNYYGQLGDGTTTNRLKPRAIVGP